jgi:hypothetical protein
MEIEHIAALVNAGVSGTIFLGCIVLIATFWMG